MIDLSNSSSESEYENMLPLINVVFLLLIFFLLAGSFTSPDIFLVEPPVSSLEEATEINDQLILINQKGELGYQGERIQEAQLGDYARELSSNTFQIKADASAPATRVITIIELLHEAGVKHVELLTVIE